MEIYSKHKAQVNRKPTNFSKSIKLDIQKYCNKEIRLVAKSKTLSEKTKESNIAFHKNIIKSLYK